MRVVREHKLPPTSPIPGHWSPSAPSLSLSLCVLLHGKKERRRKMTGGRRRKKRKRKIKTDRWAPAQSPCLLNRRSDSTTKKPSVGTLRLPWGCSRFTIPDVGPLVVKPGKTQTHGRSAAPGTPRLDAYNCQSFTIPSTSTARRTISSRALCDLSRSAATHGCRSNTSAPLNPHKPPIPLTVMLSIDTG
uniref:Uncharacterized protein n=1 Tax=Oryza rufipogon TaxID=4529 RepID=A0A0E0RFX0_ORYRU